MPRLEMISGEKTLPPVGVIRGGYGFYGAGGGPQGGEFRQVGFEPPKPPRKRPCKTCNGEGCVWHCKF